MRIQGCTVEYSLGEAAKILAISPDELKRGVEEGHLRYYYRRGAKGYQFHEASILTNQQLLSQRNQSLKRKRVTVQGVVRSEARHVVETWKNATPLNRQVW